MKFFEEFFEGATYGAEIEWTDWNARDIKIPPHLGWLDYKEVAINNTDGSAFDWTKKNNPLGGEVCFTPVSEVDDLLDNFCDLVGLLQPSVSHRSSTQIHIAIPGLKDDVETLKKIVQWTIDNKSYYKSALQPQKPNSEKFPSPDDLRLAKKHYQQMTKMAFSTVQKPRLEEMMSAETFEEFYDAHFAQHPKDPTRRLKHLAPRPFINTRSLLKHGTLEFRTFRGTTKVSEFQSVVEFCQILLYHAAVTGEPMEEWYEREVEEYAWEFPPMPEFIPGNERCYEETFRPFPLSIGDNYSQEAIDRLLEREGI